MSRSRSPRRLWEADIQRKLEETKLFTNVRRHDNPTYNVYFAELTDVAAETYNVTAGKKVVLKFYPWLRCNVNPEEQPHCRVVEHGCKVGRHLKKESGSYSAHFTDCLGIFNSIPDSPWDLGPLEDLPTCAMFEYAGDQFPKPVSNEMEEEISNKIKDLIRGLWQAKAEQRDSNVDNHMLVEREGRPFPVEIDYDSMNLYPHHHRSLKQDFVPLLRMLKNHHLGIRDRAPEDIEDILSDFPSSDGSGEESVGELGGSETFSEELGSGEQFVGELETQESEKPETQESEELRD